MVEVAGGYVPAFELFTEELVLLIPEPPIVSVHFLYQGVHVDMASEAVHALDEGDVDTFAGELDIVHQQLHLDAPAGVGGATVLVKLQLHFIPVVRVRAVVRGESARVGGVNQNIRRGGQRLPRAGGDLRVGTIKPVLDLHVSDGKLFTLPE
jgi:hypothetical protein